MEATVTGSLTAKKIAGSKSTVDHLEREGVDSAMKAPTDSVGPHEAVTQLLRVLDVLRRRWLVWGTTTLALMIGAGLVLRFIPERFEASASLVLHQGGPEVLDKVQGLGEEKRNSEAAYDAYYQTQRAIMGSRAVAERALDRLGLLDDPRALRDADGPLFAAPPEADGVERLGRLISIEEVRGSRVVEITATHPDPQTARDLANSMAQAYLEHVRTSRRSVGQRAEDNLATERRAAAERLGAAEQALQQFKEGNRVTSTSLADRQNVITQDVLSLSAKAKQAEAEAIRRASVLSEARAHFDAGDVVAAMMVLAPGEPSFERLQAELVEARAAFRAADLEFGPKHAVHREAKERLRVAERDLRKQAQARLASLDSRVSASRGTQRGLERSLDRERARALALGGLERRHHELRRDAKTAEEEYLLIARRDTEVALTNRVESEGIELLDHATTPAIAAFPHRGVALAVGALAGFGLGLLLAFIIDARDHRLRDVADLERALSADPLPVLGQLPTLRSDPLLRRSADSRAQLRLRDLHVHRFPGSLMAERCRGIRTSLAFVHESLQHCCIMVTSPGASEGKSSVALSLAISLCQADKKVALIDADMRRPRLHGAFESLTEHPGGGLSALLRGQARLDEVIVTDLPDAPASLDLIPCGAVSDRPAELLDSAAFTRALAQLREQYDVVLIDTPPVLPVADPLIVARAVDGVLMVSRVRRTTAGAVQRTVSQLRRADARLLGIVLNEVDERGGSYAYGYRYGQGGGASRPGLRLSESAHG